MATQTEPEIILYDLACIKNVCFSPVVWRIRLMLNYKRVSYKTVFLEFPDIEPTLKGFGLMPHTSTSSTEPRYTVPAIRHVPTNTYMMDSAPIAQFIEQTYPDPPVPLTSELGREIEAQSGALIDKLFSASLMPREIHILSPRTQAWFRRTREASLGHRLEDLLDLDQEEQNWEESGETIQAVGELMRTNKARGPFVLGAQPSYTDFFIAGALQCARVIDEGVFQRNIKYPGYRDVYDACTPYMERKD